jgi:hypothetical protein
MNRDHPHFSRHTRQKLLGVVYGAEEADPVHKVPMLLLAEQFVLRPKVVHWLQTQFR